MSLFEVVEQLLAAEDSHGKEVLQRFSESKQGAHARLFLLALRLYKLSCCFRVNCVLKWGKNENIDNLWFGAAGTPNCWLPKPSNCLVMTKVR